MTVVGACVRLGAAAGMRSMVAPAALSRTGSVNPILRVVLHAASAGEFVADKLPGLPSRLTQGPLAGRVVIGATAGWILARRHGGSGVRATGALAGAAGALVGAFGGYHVRRGLTFGVGLPDLPVALLEDYIAVTIASEAVHFDPSFTQYGETVLHFRDGPSIDLRLPVRPADCVKLRSLGLDEPFAIITAHNPHGQDADPQSNARRHRALLHAIRPHGARYRNVAGCSPDGEHCEDGVAAIVTLDAARSLAAEFGQTAIFWFDGKQFLLYPAAAAFQPVPLPASVAQLADAAKRHQP